MPNYLHRTTKEYQRSLSTIDLQEPVVNYIEQPDLSAVTGFNSKYWTITGDVVSLMSQAERDVVDTVELIANRDSIANEIDQVESYTKAFALAVLDEFNSLSLKINEILDAIDAGANAGQIKTNVAAIADRPARTVAQLKAVIRSKLNG